MYSVQNRNKCRDCKKSYKDRNFSTHLISKSHNDNVMKKLRCSCNTGTTLNKLWCNGYDLTCCMSKWSLESDVGIQTDFSDKQDITKKQSNKYKNIDPNILGEIYRKNYSDCCKDGESIVEGKARLADLYRVKEVNWEDYIKFLGKYFDWIQKLKYSIWIKKCIVYKIDFFVVFVTNLFDLIIIQVIYYLTVMLMMVWEINVLI